MHWDEQLENYRRVLDNEPYMASTSAPQLDWEADLAVNGRWVFGMWLLGQSPRVPSGYYGG
jgi:hypothetical protein